MTQKRKHPDISPAITPTPAPAATTAESALFRGEIQGLVVSLYQNERPPCGLAGIMDWYFQGAISYYLQRGAIVGTSGECVYLPLTKNQQTFHLVLLGLGDSTAPGQRSTVPPKAFQALKKNLVSLKLKKIGISRADLGNASASALEASLQGVPLWIAN